MFEFLDLCSSWVLFLVDVCILAFFLLLACFGSSVSFPSEVIGFLPFPWCCLLSCLMVGLVLLVPLETSPLRKQLSNNSFLELGLEVL
jgi:hypothetical protein